MSVWRAALAVVAGLAVYVVGAVAATRAVRRAGQRLESMEARTSPRVMAIGAVANVAILAVALLMVPLVLQRPIGSLGFRYDARDIVFCLIASAALGALAVGWVLVLARRPGRVAKRRSPTEDPGSASALLALVALLIVVAAQEEVLFRGYMTASLRTAGPATIIAVTALLFAVVHVLTNPVSVPQMASWLVAGAVFGWAYLLTGTLWVPVVVHFATDLVNVVVFDIVGRFSFLRIEPRMTPGQRAGYRAVYVAALVLLLLAFYGPHLRLGI